MAQAIRKNTVRDLETNGIVRSAVFPNAVRDVRRRRGFDTLRAFDGQVDVTYTRLAKIERGEIFPTADELKSIARAMGVPVSSLLIDPSDPTFDRERWARDHIEAKLAHRGGGIEAMKLGAAIRIARLGMKRSTTDMKEFGIPAATMSRIENADRPIERWDIQTQKGIAKILKVRGTTAIRTKVEEMFNAGDLDEMLHQLFSPESLEERNNRKLKALLQELPGKKVARLLDSIDPKAEDVNGEIAVFSSSMGKAGEFEIEKSERLVRLPDGAGPSSIAIEIAEPVLGPGLPRGTIVVADPDQEVLAGDVAVIVSPSGDEAHVISVASGDHGLVGFSMAMTSTLQLNNLPKGSVIAKMIATVA